MSGSKIGDGGPAFPRLTEDYTTDFGTFVSGSQGGMTLRDWFAGQALAACMDGRDKEHAALVCYEFADAMLAARQAGGDA